MMLERWIGRCAIFLVAAGMLAVGQAAVQPPAQRMQQQPASAQPAAEANSAEDPTRQQSAAAEPAEPAPGADVHSIDWVRQHYDAGTALFVDARPLGQYEEEHLDGAIHLDFGSFSSGPPAKLDIMRQGLPLVIYCTGGDCDASHKVKEMLGYYGFDPSQMYVFVPGWPGIEEAGLPMASGPPMF